MSEKRCDWCGKKLTGKRKRFCCNRHKDKFHNHNNPRGRFAHLANVDMSRTNIDDYDGSWDAHNY